MRNEEFSLQIILIEMESVENFQTSISSLILKIDVLMNIVEKKGRTGYQ